MNETQRRIKAYKAALPGLRERVIAVALLLAMSVAMMTSATFAWITISRAPELSGVSTTVAANGNLEIALAQGDGRTPPGESQVGDSAAAENQTITGANVTWGNLVNLSDPIYGLDQISLRPALLSEYNLNRYPLYGASYGNDGRVVATTDRYEFTSLTVVGNDSIFMGGDKVTHGVRAIASVKYENVTGNAVVAGLITRADTAYGKARQGYIDLVTGTTKINDHTGASSTVTSTLGSFLSIYAQDLIDTYINNQAADSDCSKYIVPIYNMMLEFRNILKNEGEALMELANIQAYVADGSKTDTFTDVEAFLNETTASLKSKGVELIAFSDADEGLKNDWNILNEQIKKLEDLMTDSGFYNENGTYKTSLPVVKWSQFETIMDKIVKIATTEMDGTEIGSVNSSNAMDFARSVLGGNPDVLIKDGIIRNLEQRIGARMADKETMGKKIQVTVSVKLIWNMTPTATVSTNAAPEYYWFVDKGNTEALNSTVQGGDAVSKDTFGMAIDLWVRTNTPNVVLTLEGSTSYTDEPAMGKDKYGNSTQLYVLLADGVTSDIYKLTEDGETLWYYADTHEQVDSALMTDFNESANKKMNKIVSGYEGENRIWEDWEEMLAAGLIMEDNTTQGAGSCFVFYGDPSEQARILDLLNSFTVAFIDGDGNRLGTAMLATDRAYAVNGKVTVPLEMVNGTAYEDENGEEKFGIRSLTQNKATRISAIVYLNGMRLENKNVLAEGKIEGNLNLQFGSSVSLTNPDNEKLQTEYRTITAIAHAVTAPTSGSPTTSESASAPILYEYDATAKKVRVDLTVDGEQPERIYGFFVRTINATQGSRGESVYFSDEDQDGVWSAVFDLTTPGKYIIRSVIVDGAEYTLDQMPSVEISGYTISSVTLDREPGMHMTADGSFPVEVKATIETDPALMPKQVRAQFRSDDGKEFNALMSYDELNSRWVGTANINSSGTYTLVYLVIDGEYTDIPEQLQKTLIIKLGMTTRIYSDHVESFTYEGNPVTIPVQAKVWDDIPTEIGKLEGVKLYYHVSGSALDQNGMQAELTWNENTGYYEGNMLLTVPGTYSFDRLEVTTTTGSKSIIRKALAAPSYTAISLEPPTFYAEVENSYQLAPQNDAALTIKMADASAAKIWAKVVKTGPTAGAQATYVVAGNIGDPEDNINPFSFTLPAAEGTGQDGEWVITDLYLQNVYVPNENAAEGEPAGKMYESTVAEGTLPTLEQLTTTEADKFYHIDVSNKGGNDGIYTYVVSTVHVAVTKNGASYSGEAFGGTKTNPTGTFMQEHEVSGVTFTVTDWKGAAVQGVDSVVWTIHYNQATDVAYGGYDDASLDPNEITIKPDANDASKFTAPTQTLYLAGEYTSSLVVNMGGGSLTPASVMPSYTVASIKPSVTVKSVSPSGSVNSTVSLTSSWGKLSWDEGTSQTNQVVGKTATAYAKPSSNNLNGNLTFTNPQVTFTVSGVDGDSTVTFTIGAGTSIPTGGNNKTGSASAKTFTKKGNGDASVTLGDTVAAYINKKSWISTFTGQAYCGQGTKVIKEFTITRGTNTYTVTLAEADWITIVNPSTVPTDNS